MFVKVGKRKIQKEKKGITVLVSVFCSLLVLYAGTLFYYMKQVNYVVERYGNSSMVQEVGLDNAIWKFTTTFGAAFNNSRNNRICWMFYTHLVDLEKITAEVRKDERIA